MKKLFTIIFLSALFAITGLSQSIYDSLIVFYPFDGDAIDHSSNGFNGTLNGPIPAADRFGNPNSAFYFDGVDDYIGLPNILQLKPSLPVTFSFWVKVEDLSGNNTRFVATDFDFNNYAGFWIHASTDGTGKISANFGSNAGGVNPIYRRTIMSDSSITVGNWHHIACVFRGAIDMDVYIDGKNAGGTFSGTGQDTVGYSSEPGRIAAKPGNSGISDTYFWGTMDDFAFWHRALNEEEISELWTGNPLSIDNKYLYNNSIIQNTYPNPFSEYVIIELKKASSYKLTLYVYDAIGNIVSTQQINTDKIIFERGDLKSGIYFYCIKDSDQKVLGHGKLAIK